MTIAEEQSSHSADLYEWLDYFFEEQEGYVYVPTKRPKDSYWQPHFFKWPEHRDGIVTHILAETSERDVYLAPSLFKTGSGKKSDWKGTHFVWIEFDGNAPATSPDGIPKPNLKVQSSEKGHEHWYWKLESWQTDYKIVQGLTKKLTYQLEADHSGWAANKVLRPPGTLHHDSGRRTRVLKPSFSGTNKLADFKNLIQVPNDALINIKLNDLPDIQEVISKFKWPEDAWDLFKKPKQEMGKRSSALTKLALYCVEMGMTNEEAYSVLYNADERWKKYVTRRSDFKERLLGVIGFARAKKGLQSELLLSDREPTYILRDFLTTEIKVEWVYKDLLHREGLGILSSAPGVGKSQLSLRLGFHAAVKRDFLAWPCSSKKAAKFGFVSCEMGHAEIRAFIDAMWPGFTEEEQEILKDNVAIMPLGYSLPLDTKKNQDKVKEFVDVNEIDFLLIDSLKATTSSLQEDKVDKFFEFVNKDIRSARGATTWLIHHNRKPPTEGPKKPKDLSDLYGDTFITAHPTSVVTLWGHDKNTIEVINLKTRLAELTDPFMIHRAPNFDWTVGDMQEAVNEKDDGNDTPSRIEL